MFDAHEFTEFDDSGLDDRQCLLEHLNFVIFPGCRGWFVDQMVEAIELAAAGEDDAWIEVDGKRRPLSDVIEFWELAEFVEEAKAGEFKPRGGNRTWRCEVPRPIELDDDGPPDG